MTEQIGKITLDLSRYPGEDFYCDGQVEDELLEIVRKYSQVEYQAIIEERKSWPILYHLSPVRENIIDWVPMSKDDKVLEVGSGCGAITGALARKAGSVTCVDLSKKRSMINAYRHSECDNVTIHVGNFKDIEPDLDTDYDYICLIGVFEYGQGYIGGQTPYEDFLRILQKHLKAGGRILIAIENKYGLKYFAGCKEDHLGTWFSGIENYAQGGGVRTFSRNGLEKIFKTCGVEEYHFYYPYPDYKLMTTVYSDAYLPGRGELAHNLRNFDRDRMILFDETNAFDGIAEDDLFPVFANSYLAVIGADFSVKYVKYSNDRAREYQIRTEITQENGVTVVRKYPFTSEAEEHVQNMAVAYKSLQEKYRGGKLEVNHCELEETAEGSCARFEYVDGTPLSALMDACVDRGDMEGFQRLFREYVERIGYNSEAPVTDFDAVFSNVLVNGDTWTLIDYEWTFGRAVDISELAFRAVYYYLLENESRNRLELDTIFEELKITEQDAQRYREQEEEFQKFVAGKQCSMAQIRNLIGYRVLNPIEWVEKYQDADKANLVQIYEDKGTGYHEEESYFVKDAFQREGLIDMELTVSGNVKMLRIDPGMEACAVKILEMTLNGEKIPLEKRKVLLVNGRIAKAEDTESGKAVPTIIFPTHDPNININLEQLNRQADNVLYTKMEVVKLPLAIAEDLAKSVKRLI